MTQTSISKVPELSPRERLIIALDVSSSLEALSLFEELKGEVGAFKVGLQLFSAEGPEIVRTLVERGAKVFLDLKFHDIPNTVAMAAVEAAKTGAWMLNVHASGGSEMMRRTADEVHEFCQRSSLMPPKLIAVTVLTSTDSQMLHEIGVTRDLGSQVVELAKLTERSGFDGLVASPREVPIIRNAVNTDGFLVVTPGIRPTSATKDDQKRVTTFAEAITNGADYVVVGRPITKALDRVNAVRELLS
ncbi:MAG: orotidine-5'-phosphate decarboxylase [Pyrinomonadaceae bacterium]|nr:orotidine-5'-phosphate decarboxylase [Pyrinomonadaceae bacterium]